MLSAMLIYILKLLFGIGQCIVRNFLSFSAFDSVEYHSIIGVLGQGPTILVTL